MEICPLSLIIPGSEGMPFMPDEVGAYCTKCGSCEAFCPEGAITPQFKTTHPIIFEKNVHGITPGQMGIYMRQRRSIRNYKDRMIDRETIEE
ncbi:MAG: nitroreductase, partial [Methanolobus sp. T82-4]